MSVVVSKRGKSKFDPLLKSQKVAKHILIITANEKIFKMPHKALIQDINHCAEDIFISAYMANNIYANNLEAYKQRIQLETKAILDCKSLLALMDLAWQIFHLKSTKVQYVVKITNEAEKSLQAWRKSDKEKSKKYGELA